MFKFVLAVFLATQAVMSLPSPLARRSTGAWCDGLGGSAYDLAYNFSLSVVNSTLPNANSTGAPLVLNPQGQDSSGVATYNLATYNSQPDTIGIWPNFTLEHGTLLANYLADLSISPSGDETEVGGPVTLTSDANNSAKIYCGVADTDPEQGAPPLLALYTNLNEFSICHQREGGEADLLIYNATSSNSLYDYVSCYPVLVHLLYNY
ncbi:hypothetical protein NEOLEDRAFT_1138856 [Neolentinus lepideus HHB14362 ss-1]|uniref:Uncharacterized protein n=1 Tax=Neolentinus lepideus HHB14362 ss-1 TaxID=1314782 RepID=A0A165Q321_9AGAM|nr:hypothetical protein NEOLEDRAFT_1138856 [Neolentinus lepideus HHB14362 ss-1]